jgi:hypothetical protein
MDLSMSEAIKLIVDGYLTLKDRGALEDLRSHRRRLRRRLQDPPKSWVDAEPEMQLFDEDLGVIEAALNRL